MDWYELADILFMLKKLVSEGLLDKDAAEKAVNNVVRKYLGE